MNTSEIGNIGEARVLTEFVKLGIPCYIPYGDGNTIDIIAYFNGKLNKIQVKTTEKVQPNGSMKWNVTRQNGYHGSRQPYSKDEVDYFAFYCLENDIVCLVPFDKDFPKSEIFIMPDSYTRRRLKTMRFAEDFSVSKITS